jgi:hypothetical protein
VDSRPSPGGVLAQGLEIRQEVSSDGIPVGEGAQSVQDRSLQLLPGGTLDAGGADGRSQELADQGMDAEAQAGGEFLREVRGTRQETQLATGCPFHQGLAEETGLGWAGRLFAEAELAAQGVEAAQLSRAEAPGDPRQILALTLALTLVLARPCTQTWPVDRRTSERPCVSSSTFITAAGVSSG